MSPQIDGLRRAPSARLGAACGRLAGRLRRRRVARGRSWPASSSASWPCRCRWRWRSRPACRRSTGSTPRSSAVRVIALLGGSRVQVSGPTAAFVVILAPISARFGLGGLLLATRHGRRAPDRAWALAGMGQLIEFVPYPGDTGFTAGIAVVIATLQLKDFLGLDRRRMPEHYLERVAALVRALAHAARCPISRSALSRWPCSSLWPRVSRRVPAPLGRARRSAAVVALRARALAPGLPGRDHRHAASRTRSAASCMPGSRRCRPCPCCPGTCPGRTAQPLALSLRAHPRARCRPRSRSPCWARSSRCSRRWSPTA